MKTRTERVGTLTIEYEVYERTDPIECLADGVFEELIVELKYLGVHTIGEFADNQEDILNRITARYPHFFDELDYTREDVVRGLNSVE